MPLCERRALVCTGTKFGKESQLHTQAGVGWMQQVTEALGVVGGLRVAWICDGLWMGGV